MPIVPILRKIPFSHLFVPIHTRRSYQPVAYPHVSSDAEADCEYSKIESGADAEADCESSTTESEAEHGQSFPKILSLLRGSRSFVLFQIIILTASMTFAMSGVWLRSSAAKLISERQRCYVDDGQCTVHLSAPSPLIDAHAIEYEAQRWLIDDHVDSKYVGPPTYERELAWRELDTAVNVPDALLHGQGSAHMQPSIDEDPHAAILEVHFQLYCLSALRQWSYKDEYLASMVQIPELFSATSEEVHKRLDHCIEVLRLRLMCAGDVTPMLLHFNSTAYLDLSTRHKCRKFDKIVEWQDQNVATELEVSFDKLF